MKLIAILAIALLAGCATRIQVDYLSDPPGSTLYEEGRPVGVTPLSLYYEQDQAFKNGGCLRTKGMSAVWASGAKAETPYMDICSSKGLVQHIWLRRPDVPGREVDMNYAIELQRNGIMRAQAAATLMNSMKPPAPVQPYVLPAPPQPTRCRSYRIGNEIRTDCN